MENKPQYQSQVECLEALIGVMKSFYFANPIQALRSQYVLWRGHTWNFNYVPNFHNPEDWSFAVGAVAGKAVFIGSRMFDHDGREVIVTKTGVDYRDAEGRLVRTRGFAFGVFPSNEYFWEAPKKKAPPQEPSLRDSTVALIKHIEKHLQQLAPHQAQRESALLLLGAIAKLRVLLQELDEQKHNDCVCKDPSGSPLNRCHECPRDKLNKE